MAVFFSRLMLLGALESRSSSSGWKVVGPGFSQRGATSLAHMQRARCGGGGFYLAIDLGRGHVI
jgi:hypothetical protein